MKNINILKLASLVFVLTVFTFYSCNEDFLNQANNNSVNTDTFWQSPNDFEKAVNGMYHPITNTFFWGRIIHTGAMLRSDVFNVRPFDANTALSTLQGVPGVARWATEVWQEPFKCIYRANSILENMTEEAVPNEAQRNGFTGQAYFMRAFSNWYLVNLFQNVPLITSTPKSFDEYFPSQATPEAVWDQIIADLEQAKNLLPATWDGANTGRASAGAATALLGKSHLYRKNWAAAETAFNEVINSGTYSLLPTEQFGDNFGFENENNQESVFELQYLGLETFTWGVDVPGVGTQGNFHIDYSPPSKSLDQSHYINAWVKNLFEANNETVRRNATLAYDYEGSKGYGGTEYETDFADDIALAASENMQAIFSKKYAGLDVGVRANVAGLGNNVGNNWRIIRYADVLLMQAEALNNQGKTDEALALINQVRERADVEILEGLSQTETVKAIIDERVLELTGEGHRYFDLVRWGLANDYLGVESLHGDHPKSLSGGTFTPNRDEYLWIPVSELAANDKLIQNPGY